jgi:hypothetical protein
MAKKKVEPKQCQFCEYFTLNKQYPGYHAGTCDKGVDMFGGMHAPNFSVRETDSCKKFKRAK